MAADRKSLINVVGGLAAVAGDVVPDLVMSLYPQLSLLALGAKGGVAYANLLQSRLAQSQIEGLKRAVARVDERVHALRRDPPLDIKAALLQPDVVFLLATARDHFAVCQFRGRIRRLADVIAGRIADPHGPFDRDLLFARAALDLSPDAVRFLAVLVERATEDVRRGGRAEGPPEKQRAAGEANLSVYVRSKSWPAAEDVNVFAASAMSLELHGFTTGADRFSNPELQAVECVDGALARYLDRVWAPTALGVEFISRIRDSVTADEDAPPP